MRARSFSRSVVAAASGAYGLFAIAVTLASGLLPAPPPFLALLAAFLPWILLPLLVVLPVALWSRSRWALGIAFISCLCLAGTYGGLLLPRRQPSRDSMVDPIRVMAWNVSWQTGGEDLLEPIRAMDADVLAIEEMRRATVGALEAEFGERYPHRLVEPRYAMTGLLSRLPIVDSEWFRPPGDVWPSLRAVLNWNGTPLTVFVMHTTRPNLHFHGDTSFPIGLSDSWRIEQAADMVRRVGLAPGPVLVMGDLNMTDRNPAYRVLSRALRDAFRDAGQGFGFTWPHGASVRGIPIPIPLVRIDYILHSNDIYVQSAEVGCDGGSDHCYLSAMVARIWRLFSPRDNGCARIHELNGSLGRPARSAVARRKAGRGS